MAAPFVIGIDPATTSGFCAGRVGSRPTLSAHKFRSTGSSDEDLFGAATGYFATFLKDRTVDLIAIEAPIQATWGKTNAQTTAITRGLYAIFTGIARCKNIPIVRADIATWRKYFIGHGRLPGDEAKRQAVRLCRQLGWDVPDHNAAEAAGIWMWAGAQLAPKSVQRAEPLFAGSTA